MIRGVFTSMLIARLINALLLDRRVALLLSHHQRQRHSSLPTTDKNTQATDHTPSNILTARHHACSLPHLPGNCLPLRLRLSSRCRQLPRLMPKLANHLRRQVLGLLHQVQRSRTMVQPLDWKMVRVLVALAHEVAAY